MAGFVAPLTCCPRCHIFLIIVLLGRELIVLGVLRVRFVLVSRKRGVLHVLRLSFMLIIRELWVGCKVAVLIAGVGILVLSHPVILMVLVLREGFHR